MDLLVKVGIVALVLIAILAVALVFKYTSSPGPLTSSQAQQVVQRDLKLEYPNASITIINVTQSTVSQGSWSIFVSLVYNATRPCPTLYLQEYDYPAFGLVPSVANLYTSHCVIYGLTSGSSQYYAYLITSPEVAIAKSFNSSYPALVAYVNTYGYNSTNVYATHYQNLMLGNVIAPYGGDFFNVWLVNYTATRAPYSEYVVLNTTGSIIFNYTLTH
jgi:hypothetical protein